MSPIADEPGDISVATGVAADAGHSSTNRQTETRQVPPSVSREPASGTLSEMIDRTPDNDIDDSDSRHISALARKQRARQEEAVAGARKNDWLIRESTDKANLELMDVRDGRPLYNQTHNVNAAISTAANLVRETPPYSLSATGLTVGVWDGGHVRATHQEFGGRVSTNGTGTVENHATHVAGTISASGKVAAALGMAPRVKIESYDWNLDESEMASRAMTATGETNKLQISNHSYGFVTGWSTGSYSGNSGPHWFGVWGDREDDGFGRYSVDAWAWDSILYDSPYFLPFKSAGNDRNDSAPSSGTTFYYIDGTWKSTSYNPGIHPYSDGYDAGGYDTISARGTCKNLITVGAVNDAVSGGVRDLSAGTMSSFSCWGPTDDGRVKPDIVANGVGLYSTIGSSDTAYQGGWNGTSMSTPNAAGSAALLVEYYGNLFTNQHMRASTLKGLILHTADDIGNAGPDYANGWGLMNTKAAADIIAAHASRTNAHRILEDYVATNVLTNTYSIIADGSEDIKVTLCWTDPPGPPQSGLDNRTSVLVNNLDLRVIEPDGTTNFPYLLNVTNPIALAVNADNDIDNVEQVVVAGPTNAGNYSFFVTLDGDLTGNIQYYSIIISGSALPPEIDHTPLGNTTNTSTDYLVSAVITAETAVDTNQVLLRWNTNGSTAAFTTNLMSFSTNDTYESGISPQPVGTIISYYISAAATNGLTTEDPPGAPLSLYSFEIRPPVDLTITGTPHQVETVSPDYGTHTYPSGETVNVEAGPYSSPSNGFRYAVTGWSGSGSVPLSGSSNSFAVSLSVTSSLSWHWTIENALTQTSTPAGIVETMTWWRADTTGTTKTAESGTMIGSTQVMFASWFVDGARQPDSSNTAVNPAEGLIMSTSHTAAALYIAEDEDSDSDSLGDWWEIFYFGSTGALSGADDDSDGFDNGTEYDDNTNPRDINSFPTPPSIVHTALADPQSSPAPWTVSAVVSDNYQVASVTLWWSRNSGGWQSTSMTHTGSGTYSNAIPLPGTNGDDFVYRIVADDGADLTSTNGPHSFSVDYPIIGVTPDDLGHFVLQPGTSTNTSLVITNAGSALLSWNITLRGLGLEEDVEGGTNSWLHYGTNDLWHISTSRHYSASHSWYAGYEGLGAYANSMHAMLLTPLVKLGSNAVLSFRHWIDAELYYSDYTWDGGIVELSTNAGMSFFQIAPIGGYAHQIFGHPASPWPNGTPCFADTGVWKQASFDLSAYEGHEAVVRFHFGSDGAAVEEGWYIDDVLITPHLGTNDWLLFSAISGSVNAATSSNITAFIDSTGIPTGADRGAVIHINSNDQETPTSSVPIALSVRTPPAVIAVTGLQTSTGGEGVATISNHVYDADGETVSLEVAVSTNQGVSWSTGWMAGAQADIGSPAVSNGAPRHVYNIATESAGTPFTNRVSVSWDTTNELLAVSLSTSTLVRVRPWDKYYPGHAVTSTPFMVDNESPSQPTVILIGTHTQETWSTANDMTASWAPSDDGEGGGVSKYIYAFSNVSVIAADAASTVSTNAAATDIPDGTNWRFNVKAVDVFGNESPSTSTGPFWIDTTPPVTGIVYLQTSELGDYTLGSTITGRWSGFSDVLSGLDGYYFSLTNNAPSTNGNWTAGTNGILTGAALDEADNFFVWAADVAGNIGTSAFALTLVLDPSGDHDGDGMSNRDEETSGTGISDSNSLFISKDASPAVTNREPPTIRWPYAANREYIVFWSESHVFSNDLNWAAITNPVYSVTNGWAVWVDTNGLDIPSTVWRLYRIGVSSAQ
ncbi:MAG: S8 family serine peptidase [Verrucomicrobia bacterium]|nr:S8 family serine peptidase [Verrucomicrobiota bacterium]